jgi:hypothetical protein
MKISQIQEYHSLGELNTIDKKIEALAIIKGKTIDEIEELQLEEILEEFRKIDFMPKDTKPKFEFKHKGKRYRLITNPNKLKAHRWVELQELYSGDIIESLDKIIALLAYEVNIFGQKKKEDVTDFERKVTDFASLNFDIAHNYALFFSKVYPELLKTTLSYLNKELNQLSQQMKEQEQQKDGLN